MNNEYKKIYKSYFITIIVIILLIAVGLIITRFVNIETNKIAIENEAKIEKEKYYKQEINDKEKNYETLKTELDSLSDSLIEFNKDQENDNSEKLRYYNNLATIYDRELNNISKEIIKKLPKNIVSSFDADLNNFYKQRLEKCKKLTFGIDNNIIKGIEYYKNYANITRIECYDLLEEYSKYLN